MAATEGVTQLLMAWNEGDTQAMEKLAPLVYQELRRLAGGYLRDCRPNHTLQATALVHEAFVELLRMDKVEWKSRAHFIGLAARMMRCVLVDHARRHAAEKRGAGAVKVTLSRADSAAAGPQIDLVGLDDALESFSKDFPRQAKVIELHFFGGLETAEIPRVLEAEGWHVSQRTVERDLQFARAWLRREMNA